MKLKGKKHPAVTEPTGFEQQQHLTSTSKAWNRHGVLIIRSFTSVKALELTIINKIGFIFENKHGGHLFQGHILHKPEE